MFASVKIHNALPRHFLVPTIPAGAGAVIDAAASTTGPLFDRASATIDAMVAGLNDGVTN
jgi:hypothetical protein